MSSADRPQHQPRAQGDLAKTPFAHLVLYLHREALSGTLIVDRGGFETKVLFRNGRAIAARPTPRGGALQDALLEVCGLGQAAFAFWDGDLVGEGPGVTRGTVDPYMFVAESLRGPVRDDVISSVVDRFRRVQLTLTPDADVRRLGLRGLEARVAEQLRRVPQLGDDFIEHSELPPAEARKLLYLLLITRCAGPCAGDSSATSGVRTAITDPPLAGPRSRPSGSPSAGSGQPPAPGGTHSSASELGASVQPGSTARPGATTPPSGLAAAARPSTPAGATRTPIPAWQALASRRPTSLTPSSMPAAPPSIPAMALTPVEALDDTGKLRRAEQLAERRNFVDAARIADDLIARDPKNADYHALRAFIHYLQFTGDRPPRPLLDAIERALRLNEEQPRALYVKGLVYKRMGKQIEALRYFQRAVDADPQHLEAQRELRLAKMRRER